MAALMLFDRVNRADVRMVQRGSGARLPLKALKQLRVLFHFGREEFQRHAASELRILRLIHHAHPAGAQLFDDVVMRKRLADQRGRG